MDEFPIVEVHGNAFERGGQHGERAARQIEIGLDLYRRLFDYYAGLTWSAALKLAEQYAPDIEKFDREIAAELQGVAAGSGRDLSEVLALNCRSELLFGNQVLHECTSFALDADRTASGHMLLGQNWDWVEEVKDTTILLGIYQDPRPAVLLITEAGMVGRLGMNAAGVGLATNTLICEKPRIGVPYNVLLRAILNATDGHTAEAAVRNADRAMAANYLIGDASGFAVDVEATPTSCGTLRFEDGQIVHANHFRTEGLVQNDRSAQLLPDSVRRFGRMQRLIGLDGGRLTWEELGSALSDHDGFPVSVCRHPDAAKPVEERLATAASVIMDLTARRVFLSAGQPCKAPYVEVEWSGLREVRTDLARR